MTLKHFLLIYEAGEDYVARRTPLRALHLEAAKESVARGELVLAGALADPVDGSVFVFQAETSDLVRRFAESDPYVINGLIKNWRIREWTTVVGESALNKIQ